MDPNFHGDKVTAVVGEKIIDNLILLERLKQSEMSNSAAKAPTAEVQKVQLYLQSTVHGTSNYLME